VPLHYTATVAWSADCRHPICVVMVKAQILCQLIKSLVYGAVSNEWLKWARINRATDFSCRWSYQHWSEASTAHFAFVKMLKNINISLVCLVLRHYTLQLVSFFRLSWNFLCSTGHHCVRRCDNQVQTQIPLFSSLECLCRNVRRRRPFMLRIPNLFSWRHPRGKETW